MTGCIIYCGNDYNLTPEGGRGVVFQSGSGLCYLYFIFSDGARPFEEYLEDIKGVFKLENRKKKKEPIF